MTPIIGVIARELALRMDRLGARRAMKVGGAALPKPAPSLIDELRSARSKIARYETQREESYSGLARICNTLECEWNYDSAVAAVGALKRAAADSTKPASAASTNRSAGDSSYPGPP